MKKILSLIIVFATVFVLAGNTHAALIDYGNGLIYDTDRNITWLQDANYAKTSGYDSTGFMSYNKATAWADQLLFRGYNDWRLPDAHNYDGSYPTYGYNSDCEMAHLYYAELGNPAGGPTTQFGPFKNVQLEFYWSETKTTDNSGTWGLYWGVYNNAGLRANELNADGNLHYAWAVRDGGVGPAVKPNSPYIITLKLGKTFSFDYYWEMGINPPLYQQGYMFDVLALQGGNGWQFIGQIDAYGSSTGWNTAMLNVPQNLQGTDTQIRFVLTDYDPQTDPTVYLRNIPVPEPSLLVLLGISVMSLVGLKRWWKE